MAELRKRAERSVSRLSRIVRESAPSLPPESVQALVHELRVHQIELELQCQELQRATAEAEESRNRYQELYESIPVGYVTIDSAGRVYDLNPAGAKLLVLDGRLPKQFFAFFADDSLVLFRRGCRKVLAERKTEMFESRMRRADGAEFTAVLQAAPVHAGEGKNERIRVAFEDITARKEAEESLHQYQLELEANRAELRELAGKLFSAQEDERRRIACDIHDDHCQRITALIFECRSMAKLLQTTIPSFVPRVEGMRERLSGILADFRHLAHELHPRHLDTVSLSCSMRTHIKEAAQYSGVPIEFEEANVPAHLPISTVVCLYRLLQESLSNIRKHAEATRVTVRLSGTARGLELLIVDDGSGFDFGGRVEQRRGLGLTSMHERARSLGGTVTITSRPGQGTRIKALIPLPRDPLP